MKQRNTDRESFEKKGIRSAVIGAVIFTVIMIATELLLIWCEKVDPIPMGMFLAISAIVVVPVIGAFIVLYLRIKEIKGGEEYEASKY